MRCCWTKRKSCFNQIKKYLANSFIQLIFDISNIYPKPSDIQVLRKTSIWEFFLFYTFPIHLNFIYRSISSFIEFCKQINSLSVCMYFVWLFVAFLHQTKKINPISKKPIQYFREPMMDHPIVLEKLPRRKFFLLLHHLTSYLFQLICYSLPFTFNL